MLTCGFCRPRIRTTSAWVGSTIVIRRVDRKTRSHPEWAFFANLLGLFASWQGDYVRSCAYLDTAAALVHEQSNSTMLARTLNVLGMSLWLSGNRKRGRTVLDESLRFSLESGDPVPMVVAQRNLGSLLAGRRNERATAMLQESVIQAQRTSNRAFSLARGLSNLARVAHLQADHEQALKLLHEALVVIERIEWLACRWPIASIGWQPWHSPRATQFARLACSARLRRSGGQAERSGMRRTNPRSNATSRASARDSMTRHSQTRGPRAAP
jgi:hypothetical protein